MIFILQIFVQMLLTMITWKCKRSRLHLGSELSSKCPVLHIGEVILDIFHVKYILGSNLEPRGRRWLLVILTDFLKGIFSKLDRNCNSNNVQIFFIDFTIPYN